VLPLPNRAITDAGKGPNLFYCVPSWLAQVMACITPKGHLFTVASHPMFNVDFPVASAFCSQNCKHGTTINLTMSSDSC
jgi:hypothetical protein